VPRQGRGVARAAGDGPLLVKGIMRHDEVDDLVDLGVDGIVVSNHGGRQLDGVAGTIDVLPAVVAAAAGRAEVFVDGGIRRGTDVVKALALGARGVFVGRPYLYGLAAGGRHGVARALDILRAELDKAMALVGAPTVDDIDASLVEVRGPQPAARFDRGVARGGPTLRSCRGEQIPWNDLWLPIKFVRRPSGGRRRRRTARPTPARGGLSLGSIPLTPPSLSSSRTISAGGPASSGAVVNRTCSRSSCPMGRSIHGTVRRRPFHSFSSRQISVGTQANPMSCTATFSDGNFWNVPSPTKLVSCDM